MNKLSITPTKLNGASKKLGKKMKGLNTELTRGDAPACFFLPRSSKDRKSHAPGYARKRAKRKTQPKRTQKAGTPVNRRHKGIGELLSQPKAHVLGRPIVARHDAEVAVECVSDDAHDEEGTRSPVTKEKTRQQDAPTSPDKASDPISDFVTQQNDCGDSPQREKKRTFSQAELEEVGSVTVDTEDDMRRKQGPPKVVDESLECQQRETDTGQECHQTAGCLERQTGAVSRKHEPKDGSGVSEVAYTENERLEQEGPQLCTPGAACCKAQPEQNGTSTNQTETKMATPANAVIRGRHGIISLFDGVSSSRSYP